MKPFWAAILLGLPLCAGVRITRDGGRIVAEVDGQPFTALFVGADIRKPYFYPLRSASGKMVTRNYPVEPGKGDSTDHVHQKGLWLAHDNVNGYNFWATEPNQVNAKTGQIVLRRVVQLRSGKKSGLLRVLFDWKDTNGNLLLSEDRRVVIYSDSVLRTMDLDVVLTPAVKVTFGDSTDGFFAMRLAAGLEEPTARSRPAPKRTGRMVNSEGKETEANCWGERAAWIDYFGELEGERLGVAMFDHPSNPRHPTYWQSRGYGLFAANPFCLYHFRYDKWKQGVLPSEPDKSVNADLTIEKGAPLRFRYRVVIHPGDYQSAGIAQRYKAYAATR